MEYEVRSEGLTDFEVRFKALGEDYRESLRQVVGHAANEAGTYMAQHVPYHSGKMYQAINVSEPKFRPGGAGGGGYYEAHVSVDRSIAPHAEYVIEGTGLYDRNAPTNGIYPSNGTVLAFQKDGEGTVFTAWTTGQRPQREWFEEAMRKAERIISRRISRL